MLDGPEGHHAATVQRLRRRRGAAARRRPGRHGRGAWSPPSAEARADVWPSDPGGTQPAPDPRLVVVQGIAKGDRGELAVQAMTEVGVDEIVPWAAARSVGRSGAASAAARPATRGRPPPARPPSRPAAPGCPTVGGDPDESTARSPPGSAPRRPRSCCTRRRPTPLATVEPAGARRRSCWWSARRAASRRTSWRRSRRPGACRCGSGRPCCARRRREWPRCRC